MTNVLDLKPMRGLSTVYLSENATSKPGNTRSPNPIMLYPPKGSKKRGTLKSIGMDSPPLLSPSATYKQRMRNNEEKSAYTGGA